MLSIRSLPLCVCLMAVGVALPFSVSAHAATIGFDALSGSNGDPLTTYSEDGFTVTNLGDFQVGTIFGAPAPSIFAPGIFNGASGLGSFELTAAGGADFYLASFDFAPNRFAEYTIVGTLNGAPVFNIISAASGSFQTIVTGTSADTVDLVTFSFLGRELSFNVDNIVVSLSPVPVPEPATLLLLGTGLGAVAARRRLKKRA